MITTTAAVAADYKKNPFTLVYQGATYWVPKYVDATMKKLTACYTRTL